MYACVCMYVLNILYIENKYFYNSLQQKQISVNSSTYRKLHVSALYEIYIYIFKKLLGTNLSCFTAKCNVS